MPWPITHGLIIDIIESLNAKIKNVAVTHMKGDFFISQIKLALEDGRELVMDSRPSDAIAMALIEKVPIFVSEGLLEDIHEIEENLQTEILSSLDEEKLRKYKV
jgi:bifunctional DNase/RNase